MRNTFDKTLTDLAREDPRIFLIVGDVSPVTFKVFTGAFPERFWNVGIAEAMMVSGAAGMALVGKIPFLCTIATFMTMRCYEQIRDDIGYQHLNAKIVGIGSGVSYSTLGATHHAIEDLAIMRAIPGMTVVAPADPPEVARVTRAALQHEGPIYIRIAKNNEPVLVPDDTSFTLGKAVTVRNGADVTLVSTGTILKEALAAAEALQNENISARVLHVHTVKPIDEKAILKAAGETRAMLTVEEHNVIGGLGSAVAEVLVEGGVRVPFRRIGLRDRFCADYGTHAELLRILGLDAESIRRSARQLLGI